MAVEVPRMLRHWFVLHCLVNVVFALPLLIAPVWTLELLGWTTIDPLGARLCAAAFLGIGVESFLSRHAPVASYHTMLRLMIIWSVSASVAVAWSLADGVRAWGAFAAQGLFVLFSIAWIYWTARLYRMERT